MTEHGWWALVTLSTLLCATGCQHKVLVAAVPPPPVPMISVPPPSHSAEPEPLIDLEEVPALTVQLPRQPLPRFRPLPTTQRQLARLLPPLPPPIALGELTTGGEAGNDSLRQQTELLLRSQNQRLSALPNASVALHSRQVDDARLFLRQADEAWRKLDLEGARTLATKARLLLDEIG